MRWGGLSLVGEPSCPAEHHLVLAHEVLGRTITGQLRNSAGTLATVIYFRFANQDLLRTGIQTPEYGAIFAAMQKRIEF
jgi:hypothetical protein